MTAREILDDFWKLVLGTSPLGQVPRAVIFYLLVLVAAYAVGFVSATAGAILTLVLVLLSVDDLLKTSQASFWNLWRRVPSTLATTILARFLSQDFDYAFGIIFFVFLFLAGVNYFFPDSPPARRRRKRRKN